MANEQLPYNLVATVKRRIPKFNMVGTQYSLSIPFIQQNDLLFNIVNAMIHNDFARKYFGKKIVSLIFLSFLLSIYIFLSCCQGILRELLYEDDGSRYPNHHRVRFNIMSPGLHHEIWMPFICPLNWYQHAIIIITRSTQRAQTSLAEADHYSHIAHCKNVEPWLWKTTHPPKKKKKKGSVSLPSPRSGYATTITVFFCSFTHLTIPRSPPKFNQFFLVLLRTHP